MCPRGGGRRLLASRGAGEVGKEAEIREAGRGRD